MEPLLISNLVLWAVVLMLAGVVLALLRQVGVLHERIAPAGALVGGERPAVGEEAPILELTDWNGDALRIGAANDATGGASDAAETLLFFVSPTCPVCKTLLPVVRSIKDAEGLRLVVASDGERDEHAPFVETHGLARESYVLSAPLGLAFQVGRLPYAVLIGADGVVKARGLVNQREHVESLFEARERGVASLQEFQAGREVA